MLATKHILYKYTMKIHKDLLKWHIAKHEI